MPLQRAGIVQAIRCKNQLSKIVSSLYYNICIQKRIFSRTVYVLWIDLYTFHWKMKIKEKASWIKLSTQHSSDQQWLSEANCERDFDQARSCVTFTIWCWYFCIFLGHRWIETFHGVFLSLMSTNQFLTMILSQSAGNRVLRHLTWDGLQSNPNGTLQRQDWRGIIYFCSFSLLRSKAWAWMSTSLYQSDRWYILQYWIEQPKCPLHSSYWLGGLLSTS